MSTPAILQELWSDTSSVVLGDPGGDALPGVSGLPKQSCMLWTCILQQYIIIDQYDCLMSHSSYGCYSTCCACSSH